MHWWHLIVNLSSCFIWQWVLIFLQNAKLKWKSKLVISLMKREGRDSDTPIKTDLVLLPSAVQGRTFLLSWPKVYHSQGKQASKASKQKPQSRKLIVALQFLHTHGCCPWQPHPSLTSCETESVTLPHECLHSICIDKYFSPPRLQTSYLRSKRQLQALGPGILWISYLLPSTVWNFLPNRMLVNTCWEKLNIQHYYLTPMFTRVSSRRPADQMKRPWASVNSASLSFLLNILCPW